MTLLRSIVQGDDLDFTPRYVHDSLFMSYIKEHCSPSKGPYTKGPLCRELFYCILSIMQNLQKKKKSLIIETIGKLPKPI